MRRAARVDGNQKHIVGIFRKLGATVAHTHMIGQGFPDIVVGYKGLNHLVEIKDPRMPPSCRKLTQDEQTFFDEWNGSAVIIENEQDCIDLLGAQ